MDEKGEKVRPNQNRCIVILREVSESTPVEVSQPLQKAPGTASFFMKMKSGDHNLRTSHLGTVADSLSHQK